MRITIAHSPDSDDAYMMAPLALGWMDPEGFDIDFVRKDIEQLNLEALESRYEVTAISFGGLSRVAGQVRLAHRRVKHSGRDWAPRGFPKAHEPGAIGFRDRGHPRPAHLCLPRHEEVDWGIEGGIAAL